MAEGKATFPYILSCELLLHTLEVFLLIFLRK